MYQKLLQKNALEISLGNSRQLFLSLLGLQGSLLVELDDLRPLVVCRRADGRLGAGTWGGWGRWRFDHRFDLDGRWCRHGLRGRSWLLLLTKKISENAENAEIWIS
jgi:hypothetical protein